MWTGRDTAEAAIECHSSPSPAIRGVSPCASVQLVCVVSRSRLRGRSDNRQENVTASDTRPMVARQPTCLRTDRQQPTHMAFVGRNPNAGGKASAHGRDQNRAETFRHTLDAAVGEWVGHPLRPKALEIASSAARQPMIFSMATGISSATTSTGAPSQGLSRQLPARRSSSDGKIPVPIGVAQATASHECHLPP